MAEAERHAGTIGMNQPMSRAEIAAFNAGVTTALDHARRIARAIEARTLRPLAEGFAVEALAAFAEEGRALLLPVPDDPDPSAPAASLSGLA